MQVIWINSKVEVKSMPFVVIDRICTNQSSLFNISSVGVPCTVNRIKLLCLVGIKKIIRYDMLHQKQPIRMTDVISNLVVRVPQVNSCDLFAV